MKTKKIIFSILLISSYTFSQKLPQFGIIYYGHIESLGMGGPSGLDHNAYLEFNKNKSHYVFSKDSLEINQTTNVGKIVTDDNNVTHIFQSDRTFEKGNQVFIDKSSNKMFSLLNWKSKQYVEEIIPVIDWKLEKETKKIGSFDCKKATTSFRGREYIAWYALEIPLPYGPWKLHGLPGLILEAYDTNKEVYFYFKKGEYPANKNQNVNFIKKGKDEDNIKWHTLSEYSEYLKNQIRESEEEAIIFSKQYPGVIIETPKMKDTFLEIFQ